MKTALKKISLLAILTLFLGGCYTQIQVTERPDRPVKDRSYQYSYGYDSYNEYSEYDLGYFDGYSDGLTFRDFDRAMWSARMGFVYNPFRSHMFGMTAFNRHGFVHGFGFWHHYPIYSYYDFFWHPFHPHWYGMAFHYHSFPGFFAYHPGYWYGSFHRPIIVHNHFHAQAQVRPQMVRGSGVNRGVGVMAANDNRNMLSRSNPEAPFTRMIPGVTRVQSPISVQRTDAHGNLSRQPATRAANIQYRTPPSQRRAVPAQNRNRVSNQGTRTQPQHQRTPPPQRSSSAQPQRSSNNSTPQARQRSSSSNNNNANRNRNRDN